MTENQFSDVRHFIVGAGASGRYHENGAIKLGLKTAAYDHDHDALTKVIGRGTQTVGTLDEGLDWADQMSICTPDDRHTEIAIQGIHKGLNILCEKPFTAPGVDRNPLRDALSIRKAFRETRSRNPQQQFLVGAGYRLTPAFQEVKRLYESGELGKVSAAYATYLHDMGPYYSGENISFWRLARQDFAYGGGFHPLDLVHSVFGPVSEVSAIIAREKKYPQYDFPEEYSVKMAHENGVETQMRFSANAQGGPVSKTVWKNVYPERDEMPHGTDFHVCGEKSIAYSHNKFGDVLQIQGAHAILTPTPGIFTIDAEIRVLSELTIGERAVENHGGLPDIEEGVAVMCVMKALVASTKRKGETMRVDYVR